MFTLSCLTPISACPAAAEQ